MLILELDPEWVKPGWTPLLILIALGLVMTFLFFSMRKQFRKIDVERGRPRPVPDPDRHDAPGDGADPRP